MFHLLKTIFIEKTDNTAIQFFRYGIVGAITFFVDTGILFLLTLNQFFLYYYLIAVTISSGTALCCTYFLSILWVFKKRSVKKARYEFLIFIVIGVIGLLFNFLFVWFFADIVFYHCFIIDPKQLRILIAKVIATVIVFFWNFFIRKILLFKEKDYSVQNAG
jgi:putative flippase GtrA